MCPTIVPYMREVKRQSDLFHIISEKYESTRCNRENPSRSKAADGNRTIIEERGYELALLEKYTDKAQLLAAVADADALIIRSDKVTAEVLDAAKNPKIVVRAGGAGYDNVDLAAATAHNVVVMNTPGQNSNAVAELALGMMVFMARNQFNPGTGSELQGKTLAIHAYGNVGKLVGRKGKALGMNVIAFDPFITDAKVFRSRRRAEGGFDRGAFYAKADYPRFTSPPPSRPRSRSAASSSPSMPKGATLVNTARKEVIDEAGVIEAMTEREDLKYITDIAPRLRPRWPRSSAKAFLRYAQEDGAETAEANINAGLARCASDRGLREERQHAFPGKQVENREPIHTSW